MKIELKKLKIYNSMSEETIAFSSEIAVNGKIIGYARNDGRGGCTEYHAYQEHRETMEKAEIYALSLPPIKYSDFEIKMDMEQLIDKLVNNEYEKKEKIKEQNKLEKLMLNHIAYGDINSTTYNVMSFKGKPMFEQVIKTPQGKEALIKLKNRIQSELKPNEVIFNTNLNF